MMNQNIHSRSHGGYADILPSSSEEESEENRLQASRRRQHRLFRSSHGQYDSQFLHPHHTHSRHNRQPETATLTNRDPGSTAEQAMPPSQGRNETGPENQDVSWRAHLADDLRGMSNPADPIPGIEVNHQLLGMRTHNPYPIPFHITSAEHSGFADPSNSPGGPWSSVNTRDLYHQSSSAVPTYNGGDTIAYHDEEEQSYDATSIISSFRSTNEEDWSATPNSSLDPRMIAGAMTDNGTTFATPGLVHSAQMYSGTGQGHSLPHQPVSSFGELQAPGSPYGCFSVASNSSYDAEQSSIGRQSPLPIFNESQSFSSSPQMPSPMVGTPSTNIDFSSAPPILHCPVTGCDAQFTGQYGKGNFARHAKTQHGSQGAPKKFPCGEPRCTRSFRRKDARLKHHRKDHPERADSAAVARK